MRLVLDQHHRALGQVPELLVKVGEDLVAVGVAACDQPGPSPAGDLTDPSAQGPLADGGTAKGDHSRGIVQAMGWTSSRRMRWPSRGLPRRGRPARGRSESPAGPWVL
jgi:hypothetical protein